MGWVALVGAGPGDPGLLTLKGRTRLGECDVVIYDSLVDSSVLEFSPQACMVALEKRRGSGNISQEQINRLLIREARMGRRVVRLKGGDPYIFGRGGEEALALGRAGIPFEVVPGVSAGHAVPAYAGIPLTHRKLSSQVTFVTGHEAPGKEVHRVRWAALARQEGTLVVFMAFRQLPFIVRALVRNKRSPNTKISIIEWGTTAHQNVVSGTLADIKKKVSEKGLHRPALAVIGEVNRLRSRLKWFENLPLFGTKVLVTRAREQAGSLNQKLRMLGAEVAELPAIDIRPVPHSRRVARVLKTLNRFDALVFTSANGVEHFWHHLKEQRLDARALSHLGIVVIGPSTAEKLRACGIESDCMPKRFTTQGILALANQTKWALGKRILLARSDLASKELPAGLKKAGARDVVDLRIYRTRTRILDVKKVAPHFSNSRVPYLTFASASAVRGFVRSLGDDCARSFSRKSRVISIGPVTSKEAARWGVSVAGEAKRSTEDGLVEAILEDRSKADRVKGTA